MRSWLSGTGNSEVSSAWIIWMWETSPAAGLLPLEAGAVIPASGSSVRGTVRVSASPTSGAAPSLAVSAGSPQRVSMVFRTEV